MLHTLLIVCLTGHAVTAVSQTTQTLSYTTKDGLPSNSVYRTVLDQNGYLWIATENGLAKFDGRTFKIYTTAQGLPDNEITDLFIDSNHTVWVIPFRKTISYYNPVKDRFENDETNAELKKIEQGNACRGSVLQYGGVAFSNNERNFFIYKNGRSTAYKGLLNAWRTDRTDRIIEYKPDHYILICSDSLRYFSDGRITRTVPFGKPGFYSEYFQHTLFTIAGNQMSKYRVSEKGEVTLLFNKDFPFPIRIFCKAGKDLAVTSFNGTTYPVDTATLELKDPLLYKIPVRSVLEDKNGSIWISTIDRGLIKIQQKRISSFTASPEMIQVFNTLLLHGKKIVAGNIYGETLAYDRVYDVKRASLFPEKNVDGTVRSLVEMKNGIYVACQTGSYMLDKSTLQIMRRFEGSLNRSTKAAAALNDSVILLGDHSRAYQYNTVSGRYTDSAVKRITAFGVSRDKQIYIGSNEGLFRWDKNSLYYFGDQYKVFTYRVSAIEGTADNLVWIGLGSDSLLVIRDNKLIQSIPLGNIIPGNVCKSLFSNRPGEIWLGTNKGLNKIQYKLNGDELSYSNTYFSTADGLIGQQVNDMAIYNDTLYVATDGGINYLPVNLHLPVTDITTFITKVAINGKDTLVMDDYSLPYDKNDISIEFSGVDLTGYFPFFEYRINGGNWLRTDKNSIELRLPPGKTNLQIRALKRDGTPSSQVTGINIYIRTPFWKNSIFWTSVGILLFVISVLVLQNRNRQKQKKALEKILTEKKLGELEMQALKAQINPHFVFNCLNSIKGFIYDKDYAQADKYLDKFADLMRSTIDNSDASIISLKDEIAYLDNYLQLEKLRFDEKFRYVIQPDADLDQNKIYVPAMLLQPYVENAIRHGMRFLENREGLIRISARMENDLLVCEIDDNGIGREKATELKSRMHIEYQGKGMSISKRRAALYHIQQEVIDKKDDAGNATGTTIIIKIPLDLKP